MLEICPAELRAPVRIAPKIPACAFQALAIGARAGHQGRGVGFRNNRTSAFFAKGSRMSTCRKFARNSRRMSRYKLLDLKGDYALDKVSAVWYCFGIERR